MRLAPLLLMMLSGCATSATVTLPLHPEKIDVPHSVGREFVRAYVVGYESGWKATLQVFADDIDHKWTLMESIAHGDPNYLDGWSAAREDAEAMIRQLVTKMGKDDAQAKLREAVRKQASPTRASRSTPIPRPENREERSQPLARRGVSHA